MKLILVSAAVVAVAAMSTAAMSSAYGQAQLNFTAREGQVEFALPSSNIGCVYTPAGGTSWYQTVDGGPELSCDRVEPTYLRLILTATGPGEELTDVGDQGCCGDTNVLPYGERAVLGPFLCESTTHGLTCTRGDGHGFFVSRSETEVY